MTEYHGKVVEWEFSEEEIVVGDGIGAAKLSRYSSLKDIVKYLTKEGCAMHYDLLSVILLCLPSFSSFKDFYNLLVERFKDIGDNNDITPNNVIKLEQIQMKVLVIFRCWAKSQFAYSDISGALMENILDFFNSILNNNINKIPKTVLAATKQIKDIFILKRNNYQKLELAQAIYIERAQEVQESLIINKHGTITPEKKSVDEISNNEENNEDYEIESNDSNHSIHSLTSRSSSRFSYSRGNLASISLSNDYDCSLEKGDASRVLDDVINNNNNNNININDEKTNLFSDFFNSSNNNVTSNTTLEIDNTSPISPSRVSPRKKLRNEDNESVIHSFSFEKLIELLCVIEQEDGIMTIHSREFIGLSWTKKKLKSVHPELGGCAHLCRIIHLTNQRVAWIAREIIDYGTYVGSTAECIEYFIRLGRECLKRNNFNSLFQIVTALCLPSVKLLKAAWANVPKKKIDLFKKLCSITSPDKNYLAYRNILESVKTQPHILCIQVLLRDIVLLEGTGPWILGGQIDIKKAHSLYEKIMSYTRVNDGGVTNYIVRINKSSEEKIILLQRHGSTPKDKNLSPKSFIGNNYDSILATTPNTNMYINKDNKPQSPKGISIENTNFFQKKTQLSQNSWVANVRFVRDSFFEPLNDNYITRDIYRTYSDINSNNKNNSNNVKSPKYNSPNNNSISPKAKSPFSNIWKSLTITSAQDIPILQCEDDDLLFLTKRINCVSTDLNILWNDAKVADEMETKRLMRRLQQSGLF